MARKTNDASPLASPAIGTAAHDLISPCHERLLRAADPAGPPTALPLALAFSGGGFRATLAALGVLRFLAQTGLLSDVRYVSSVSGGSVAGGLFAHHYGQLEEHGFSRDAVDDILVRPFVGRISTDSLTWAVVRRLWRAAGPRTTRTDLLADVFDDWFFRQLRLEKLSPACRFVFNAANLTTGVRFAFERDRIGDWVCGWARTAGSIRLAQAAAASAAVPGAFAPFTVRGVTFPCAGGQAPRLLDGGAYDNSALEAVDDLDGTLLIALNAGGIFQTGPYGHIPVVRELARANALLYRQTTSLRMREMVDRFKAWEEAARNHVPSPPWGRQGVLFGLATTFPPGRLPPEWTDQAGRPEHPDWRVPMAQYRTSFGRFPPEVCRRLIYRGWWLTGASLAAYHPGAVTGKAPDWIDF
ncbi:patatin-like phospholipase family protein [Streptomyces sp. NPDC001663]|uniref:patatin-like phospholipase family protein n=1 Tax=Streptomyces sp. NPDC001663 TaxID=3364597 RepID=UPI00368C7465